MSALKAKEESQIVRIRGGQVGGGAEHKLYIWVDQSTGRPTLGYAVI